MPRPVIPRSRKCVSAFGGILCLENITWFIIAILAVSVAYLYYTMFYKPANKQLQQQPQFNVVHSTMMGPMVGSGPSLSDPYIPPLKSVDIRGQPSIPIQAQVPRYGAVGLPVNISTSSADMPYQQIGILTKMVQSNRMDGGEPTILPLMGRSLMNGRDKWQYYTVSNTNNAVRLPVSVKGKSCTNEYGCDSIYNGDTIYVEGYDDTFKATVYENSTLRYIPM
jgi:hypothetical protein